MNLNHWCPVKNLRLLHYVRNDETLQYFEGWRGLIFGKAENQTSPTCLKLVGQCHCDPDEERIREKQSLFKKKISLDNSEFFCIRK